MAEPDDPEKLPLPKSWPALAKRAVLHTIQFLKAENEMLRSRLPRAVKTTPAERSRLLKLAEPLAGAVKELVSIILRRVSRSCAEAEARSASPSANSSVIGLWRREFLRRACAKARFAATALSHAPASLRITSLARAEWNEMKASCATSCAS